MKKTTWLLSTAMVLALTGGAWAQYPEKPITFIVAYAPGGSTDLTARILAPFIEENLGEGATVVVENRPGAGGEIGFTALAEAAPDGYTIGFVNTPNILTIPIEREVAYHWQDLELLGNVLDDPSGFSVEQNGPFKSLDELVAYAKENPGAVTVGTTGVGSDDHLAMLAFQQLADVQLTHVPFPGASAVRTALAGRHISVGAINIGEAMQYVASGSAFINLGQMSNERSAIAPDVPTFQEQGYDMVFASLRGIGAPKGLPEDVRQRLADAVAKAAEDPEFLEQAAKIFAPVAYQTPEEHTQTYTDLEATLKALWAENPWSN